MLGKLLNAFGNRRLRKALHNSQARLKNALNKNKELASECSQIKTERDRAILMIAEQNELIALMMNHGRQIHNGYSSAATYAAKLSTQVDGMAADLASKNEQIADLQKGVANAEI